MSPEFNFPRRNSDIIIVGRFRADNDDPSDGSQFRLHHACRRPCGFDVADRERRRSPPARASGLLSEHVNQGNVMYRHAQSRLNHLASVSYDLSGTIAVRPVLRNRIKRSFQEGYRNMDVTGVGSVSGATPARAVSPAALPQAAPTSVTAPRDELEISSAGKMLDRLSETPEVRAERLAQIKEAIDNGEYDTDEKLEAALSRMFDSLGIDLRDE